jgi:hypothetical protein
MSLTGSRLSLKGVGCLASENLRIELRVRSTSAVPQVSSFVSQALKRDM